MNSTAEHDTQGNKAKRWLIRVAAVAILTSTALVAYRLGSVAWRPAPAVLGAPVVILPESLDFGQAWESDAFPWTLTFANVSDRTAIVRAVHTTCPCTSIDGPSEFVLEPGGRASVKLIVDWLQVRRYDPSPIRSVNLVIVAHAGTETGQLREYGWTMTGRVRRSLDSQPLQAALGEQLVCGEPGPPIEFTIRPQVSLRQLRVKRVPDGWSANLLPGQSPSEMRVLRAIPCKLKPGFFSDEFELEATAHDGSVLPTLFLKAEGHVRRPVEVLPLPLDLGPCLVGTTARGRLFVGTRKHIATVDVVPSGDSLLKVVGICTSGRQWHIDIERMIDALGPGASSGIVRVKCGKEPPTEVEFRLRWYGIRRETNQSN